MVFLYYLGTEGSGTSNPDLCNFFCVGHGTSKFYKQHVMTAIVDCMKQMYYKWLSPEQRKVISHWSKCQFHFPNHVGCMDGTLNPLAFEPQCHDASNYSGRKYGHSLSTLVVNNDK